MSGGLLCVHAHPDDESIATGGVLARASAEGRSVAVVTCTGGERGQVVGEGMVPEQVRPRLAEVRREELTEALRLLGAGPPRFLGYRDSDMAGEPGNDDPESFWRADFDEAVARLVSHVRQLRPDVLVTYDAFGVYGHPDHVQAHRVGLVAAEAAGHAGLYQDAGPAWRVAKVYLSTFPRTFVTEATRALAARGLPSPFGDASEPGRVVMGTPDEQITTMVDVRPWLQRKREALHAHRSQLGPESFFLNVPDDLAEQVFGTECFVRLRSDVLVLGEETDLFTGLGEPPQSG